MILIDYINFLNIFIENFKCGYMCVCIIIHSENRIRKIPEYWDIISLGIFKKENDLQIVT